MLSALGQDLLGRTDLDVAALVFKCPALQAPEQLISNSSELVVNQTHLSFSRSRRLGRLLRMFSLCVSAEEKGRCFNIEYVMPANFQMTSESTVSVLSE